MKKTTGDASVHHHALQKNGQGKGWEKKKGAASGEDSRPELFGGRIGKEGKRDQVCAALPLTSITNRKGVRSAKRRWGNSAVARPPRSSKEAAGGLTRTTPGKEREKLRGKKDVRGSSPISASLEKKEGAPSDRARLLWIVFRRQTAEKERGKHLTRKRMLLLNSFLSHPFRGGKRQANNKTLLS